MIKEFGLVTFDGLLSYFLCMQTVLTMDVSSVHV